MVLHPCGPVFQYQTVHSSLKRDKLLGSNPGFSPTKSDISSRRLMWKRGTSTLHKLKLPSRERGTKGCAHTFPVFRFNVTVCDNDETLPQVRGDTKLASWARSYVKHLPPGSKHGSGCPPQHGTKRAPTTKRCFAWFKRTRLSIAG